MMKSSRLASISVILYRLLLLLYPTVHRDTYGHWMLQAFRDQCRDVVIRGNSAWFSFWWQTFCDVALSLVVEHLASRKARIMQTLTFKNQPDRLASWLFLIPGLLLSLFYVLTIHSGEITGFMWAALVGLIGFVMGHVKILRRVRIWEQFALGFVIGLASFLITSIGSPMWNLGVPALRSQPWPTIRALLVVGVCLVAVRLLGRWIQPARRGFWIATGTLLIFGLLGAILKIEPNPNTFFLWDLSWSWSFVTAIIAVVVVGSRLSGRLGILSLLAVIVALGTLNSVNLLMADIAEGRTPFGRIMLLLAYAFPLVICPAWLLLAPTWRQKKYGVLLSWGVMWVSMVLVMPVVDSVLEPHYFRYLSPLDILGYSVTYAPLFIGLWLAFTLYERQHLQPDVASEPPDDAQPALDWLKS